MEFSIASLVGSFDDDALSSSGLPLSPMSDQAVGRETHDDVDNAIQCTSRLARLVNSPKFSDVVLVVGGRKYHAHKLLLANASYVFE